MIIEIRRGRYTNTLRKARMIKAIGYGLVSLGAVIIVKSMK